MAGQQSNGRQILTCITDCIHSVFLYFRLGSYRNAAEIHDCLFAIIPPRISRAAIEHQLAPSSQGGPSMRFFHTLPTRNSTSSAAYTVRICTISDTHERHDTLRPLSADAACDILVHAGDVLMMSSILLSRDGAIEKLRRFNDWLGRQVAKHRILVPGNHDSILEFLSHQVHTLSNYRF